jgi:Cu(I)/Ag(I) efflux system membrane fusion protein
MKKTLIAVIVLAVIFLIARPFFCNSDEKSADKEEEKQKPLSISENTDAFNQSFTHLLNAYNDLKDALVASDTGKASAAALALRTATDSLKVNDIKGDTSGVIKVTAQTYTSTITGSAQALAAEKDIKSKRKDFKEIADAIYTLIHTVGYKGQKLYWDYCPMAFDKDGAYWLSFEREIKNPYFGSEMLNCGSVEDSLDYSKK